MEAERTENNSPTRREPVAYPIQIPVLSIYRYWSGIYHLFDSFGRWYGKGKCGNGIEMFDCLISTHFGRRLARLRFRSMYGPTRYETAAPMRSS